MSEQEIKRHAVKVLEGFDMGVFVRDISRDHESGWGVRALPYLVALAKLSNLLGVHAGEDR